ncbi:MAG: Ig-like domain-containing protein, partial [Candidatus Latescibacterota bacterium]
AFGEPPDVDGDPKIYMLLMDIKDYTETGGAYVAGYFSGVNEYTDAEVRRYGHRSNHTEMFYLDVNPGRVSTDDARSTLAHEFQHMIHFNHDPDEETWINEGCSTFAEWVCGYPMRPPVHFRNDPNNSLVVWSSILADYEQTGMFVAYLYEHWGGMEMIRALADNPLNGTHGVTGALAAQGKGVGFPEVFQDWIVANYLDDGEVGDGRYGYNLFDLSGLYQFRIVRTHGTYPVGAVEGKVRYSAARYIRFTGGKRLQIAFNGSDGNDFSVQLISLRDGAQTRVETMTLDALNDGSWIVEQADEVILIPTTGRLGFSDVSYRYSATEIEEPVLPGIVRVTPMPGSSDVPLDAILSVLFGAAYDPVTVVMDLGSYPGGVRTQSAAGTELTVAPDGLMEPYTTYTVTVKAGVKDQTGGAVTIEDYTWGFATGAGIVQEEEIHLAYDEGPHDFHLYWEREAEGSGVRFTPPVLPAQVLSVCLYLSDLSLGNCFLMHVAQDDGTGFPGEELTDPIQVEAQATGWLHLGLEDLDIRADGDFHVSFETIMLPSADGTEYLSQPRFGAENLAPISGRSWDRHFYGDPLTLGYEHVNTFDYAIRAVVGPIRPVAVEEEPARAPEGFALRQNAPNPFNSETVISYELSRTTDVALAIYALSGQRIRRFEWARSLPGIHTVRWDGKNEAGREVGSGIYLCRLETIEGTQAIKMVVIR